MAKSPITIRDVAKAAGVSPMAVSQVLHQKGNNVRVSESTANKIRSAATQLRYQPNRLAQSFRTKKTDTIAIVFEEFGRLDSHTGYFVQLFDGVIEEAFKHGYSVTICPKMVNFTTNGIAYDGRFDGLIWCKPIIAEETREAMRHSSIPVIALHTPPNPSLPVPQLCADNAHGIHLAVDHLHELGHRHIGFVLDHGHRFNAEARERIECVKNSAAGCGITFSDDDVFLWNARTNEFQEFWRTSPPQTAFIVFGEGQAVEILNRAKEIGVRVPQDLSIIGFDSTYYCELVEPNLTAVGQPVEQMAREAAARLIELIEDPNEGSRFNPDTDLKRYPCRLDVRASTGPAPMRAAITSKKPPASQEAKP